MNIYHNFIQEHIIGNAKLILENISHSFENEIYLDSISLEVQEKEFVSFIGPSGCGKSTLFNIISGLIKADLGNIFLDGENINGKTGLVSYMQQKDLLLPWKNIIDNVSLPLRLQKFNQKEARKKAYPLLPEFGLAETAEKYPSQLSGGMRQRAALLRTYLHSKQVLLLDEPFAALDYITRTKMAAWLKGIVKKFNLTVLFITHDIDEALFLSDRVEIFNGRPAKIIKTYQEFFTEQRNRDIMSSAGFIKIKHQIQELLSEYC